MNRKRRTPTNILVLAFYPGRREGKEERVEVAGLFSGEWTIASSGTMSAGGRIVSLVNEAGGPGRLNYPYNRSGLYGPIVVAALDRHNIPRDLTGDEIEVNGHYLGRFDSDPLPQMRHPYVVARKEGS